MCKTPGGDGNPGISAMTEGSMVTSASLSVTTVKRFMGYSTYYVRERWRRCARERDLLYRMYALMVEYNMENSATRGIRRPCRNPHTMHHVAVLLSLLNGSLDQTALSV